MPIDLSLAAVRSPTKRSSTCLGEPIEPAFLVSGDIHVSNRGGNADVHYGISGPKASGTVHAVAFKEGGGWQFRSIVVETSTGEKIDVLDRQQTADTDQGSDLIC